jgi:DNA-binding protein H-NS
MTGNFYCGHVFTPRSPERAWIAVKVDPTEILTMISDKICNLDLEAMDFDELWLLHEELTQILSEKIGAEKLALEKRLAQLNRAEPIAGAKGSSREKHIDRPPRRKYPKVLPKYCNPSVPEETWSGRGKQPRWLAAALQSGHRLEEFRISKPERSPGDETDRGQS